MRDAVPVAVAVAVAVAVVVVVVAAVWRLAFVLHLLRYIYINT